MTDLIKGGTGGFSLAPANLEEAMRLATMICNTDIVPKAFKGKEGDTLVAMMLGSEVGLNPLQSLSNIAVINGRPSIWGDAMPALCQNNPKFISMTETFDEETMTATCVVVRKNNDPHTTTFSKADAVTAGLWDKTGPWKTYPKRMLQMRARGFALRDKFADSLHGLISQEEARDITDITDQSTVVSREPTKESEPEAVLLPAYTDEQFKENFPNFEALIKSGHKTAKDIIYMVHSKFTMSESQIKKLESVVHKP